MASAYFKLRILKLQSRKRQPEVKIRDLDINNFSSITLINESQKCQCRVCLKLGNIPIYGGIDSPDISEELKKIADIEIKQNDPYPKYLCDVCHTFLQNAIIFRKQAKQSWTTLQIQTISENVDSSEEGNDFSDENSFNDSQKTEKIYTCKVCRLDFESWHTYVTHKNCKKRKNLRVQCPVCKRVLTSHLYKRHLARHQSASHLICDVCGKLYRKDNLIRHLQLHNYDLPFQCQMCPYRGRFLESLKIHMRTHTGDKPFSCDKCQLRFLTRSNLNRHLLTHKKERPFKCIECARGFYTRRDLDVHFKADHVGIKDFNCRMCGNKYGTRKALMRHELRVHKRDKMAKGRLPLYLQAEYRK